MPNIGNTTTSSNGMEFHVGQRVKLSRGSMSIVGVIIGLGNVHPASDPVGGRYADVRLDNGETRGLYLHDLVSMEQRLDAWIMDNGMALEFKDLETPILKMIINMLTDDKEHWQRHKLVSLEKELAKRMPMVVK